MKLLLLVAVCAVFIYAESKSHKPKCAGVHVNGKFYKKDVIGNGLNRPYQLAYYAHEQTIYFSYNIGDDEKDEFEIGYLAKNQKLPTTIPVVKNGFATALDEDNKLLYLGGSEGIYALNLTNSEVKHVIEGHDIWDMFFKDHLYFITYPDQRLRKKLQHNMTELVEDIKEKIYQFAIDGDNDIFITTKDGLHEIKNGTTERILYAGPTDFRAIEIDRKGTAHICAMNSLYVANKENHTLEEIAHIKNIFGVTFNHDNKIIFSNPHEIVKLVRNECK